jgi:hypothetical protein
MHMLHKSSPPLVPAIASDTAPDIAFALSDFIMSHPTLTPLRHAIETRRCRGGRCTLLHLMPPLSSNYSKNDASKMKSDAQSVAIG